MQVRDQTSPICNIVIFSHQNCCQFKDLPIIMHLKIQVSPDFVLIYNKMWCPIPKFCI